MEAVRTLVVGNGRMGTLVCDTLAQDPNFVVVGTIGKETMDQLSAVAPDMTPDVASDVAPDVGLGVAPPPGMASDVASGIAPEADLIIDFSNKAMLRPMVDYAKRVGCKLVSGTTGLEDTDMQLLAELGQTQAVVYSANYSLGVASLRYVAAQAARFLAGWDIEIVETHHNKKADAPSGTALALLKEVDPQRVCSVCYGRSGMVGERPSGEIGVHALRGGSAAGTHEVHFFGNDEELCLSHRATSRQIFVDGAIACARRLMSAAPGFYTFDELMFETE